MKRLVVGPIETEGGTVIDAHSYFLFFVSVAGLAVMAKTLLTNPRLIPLSLRAHGATNFVTISSRRPLQFAGRVFFTVPGFTKSSGQLAFFNPTGPLNKGHGLPKEGQTFS